MNLHEQREAVRKALDKAKRGHRSTAELQRKYQILTAGIMAEKIAAQRESYKQTLPAHLFELCSETDPELWAAFCEDRKRPADPSQVWTVFDVLMALTQKRVAWALAGEMASKSCH